MKLFLKEYKGFILIYYVAVLLTLFYCNLMEFISVEEVLYIITFNSFILIVFLIYKYIKMKKLYDFLQNNKYDTDLGNSSVGKALSTNLISINNEYEMSKYEYKKNHEEHLTFINHWVHQMKTPLSVIDLYVQQSDDEEFVRPIREEVDKLNKGLNMAMYFARIDDFKKDFVVQKINLYQLIMELVNKEKYYFIKKRIIPKINIDKSVEILSDGKWIGFVIEQILINGIKYSSGKGKYLHIEAEQKGETVILIIKDEGVGIASKDIKRVFDPFFTGENGRNYGESTGMGLYIAKKICDNLGHNIYIKSEVDEGTEVLIKF